MQALSREVSHQASFPDIHMILIGKISLGMDFMVLVFCYYYASYTSVCQ